MPFYRCCPNIGPKFAIVGLWDASGGLGVRSLCPCGFVIDAASHGRSSSVLGRMDRCSICRLRSSLA